MVWYRIGEAFQQHVSKRSRDELLEEMVNSVRKAREAGTTVNLFLPECTRAELDHILLAAKLAEAEGASAVSVVDSQGVARPAVMGYLVKQLKQATQLEVEVHCHNDFGLAVANVLAAYEAGADVLQVSVNGIGYRAGNAAMESVVMAAGSVARTEPPSRGDQWNSQRLLQADCGQRGLPLRAVGRYC
jgi:2-isopropylmalate synthase